MNLNLKLTACLGLLGAVLVGTGEFMLHFDPLARFGEGYAFMADVPDTRLTTGHFLPWLVSRFTSSAVGIFSRCSNRRVRNLRLLHS